MSDIVDMLRKTANKEFGTYDVNDDSVRVGCRTLIDAADIIESLRSQLAQIRQVAGAVSLESGLTVRDIRNQNLSAGRVL